MTFKEMGWECFAPGQSPDCSYGRVASAARGLFTVWTLRGEADATISGQLRHANSCRPCTGDWVTLREGNVITGVLPRRTQLSRKQPGTSVAEQVLAANIDLLFMVSGLDRDYNPRRIERYLVLALESGARPVILLNKSDLQSDPAHWVSLTGQHAPGVPAFAVSARYGLGFENVTSVIASGETAALIGSSGAGKSTLVNHLLGEERQGTAALRGITGKGRHTTTRRELFFMPGGWLLMDLPGLRELQLWADPEQIDNAFSEIAVLAQSCKFRDCAHREEPGCAVRAAGLDPQRLASYRKLQREVAFLERETDLHQSRALRKKWNTLEKNMRSHPKRIP